MDLQLQEKEYKTLISREVYYELKKQLEKVEEVEQMNFYYLDSNLGMLSNSVTIRVRLLNNKCKLQVKVPISEKGGIHIKKEYEKDMSYIPIELTSQYFKNELGIDLPNVKLCGYLITKRSISYMDDETTLFLDRNSYLNIVDYEIEIEFKDESKLDDLINNKLYKFKLDKTKSIHGKKRRFMERLQNGHRG